MDIFDCPNQSKGEELMADCIIIGAGIAGSVAARQLAEEGNKKVLILEKRNHIGGNCYDVLDEHGIMIHEYGPHIFHTNMEHVYEYLSRFTQWIHFGHEVVAKVKDQLLPIPFNLNTLYQVYGQEKGKVLEEKLVREYGANQRVSIMELRKNEDLQLQEVAEYVYENVFLYYTMKQWGQRPEEVSEEVTSRVPVLISYDNRYFQDRYQGMPLDGYTSMFQKLLDHPNIQVELGVEARDRLELKDDGIYIDGQLFEGEVIYTGALDELYQCEFGRLPYRTLDFQFEYHDCDSFQGHSVVNYTVDEDFTRITEFKFLTRQQDAKGTTIVKEYPAAYTGEGGQIPYYAILNPENQALYEKYQQKAAVYPNLHLLGRLAEYKYYNIDAMVDRGMKMCNEILETK